MTTYHENYLKYRGKCKELAEEACAANNELILVKGWYHCPYAHTKEQHWWCKDKYGQIIDPSRLQFKSQGMGEYEEYQGTFPCSNCEKEILEEDVKPSLCHGRYVLCTGECLKKFILG